MSMLVVLALKNKSYRPFKNRIQERIIIRCAPLDAKGLFYTQKDLYFTFVRNDTAYSFLNFLFVFIPEYQK